MRVKAPTVAMSVVCSAGLVAALALPVTMKAGSEFVQGSAVKLSVNWDRLAAFDAIPAYAQIAGGDVLGGLAKLRSTNAIPAYSALLNGDTSAFGDLASTDAIPAYTQIAGGDVLGGLAKLRSTDAIPAYVKAAGGDPAALTNLATLDGVPALAGAASGDLTALRGYKALSAIPEYLGLPEAAAAPLSAQAAAPEKTPAAPGGLDVVKSFVTSVTAALPGAGKQSALSVVPKAAQPDPANTPASAGDASSKLTTKLADKSTQGNGDLGKFVPKIVGDSSILFSSGGGSVDNGIRGWSKVVDNVKSALGGGSSSQGSGSGSGA